MRLGSPQEIKTNFRNVTGGLLITCRKSGRFALKFPSNLFIARGRQQSWFRSMMLGGYEELLGIVEADHHFYKNAQYTRNTSCKRKVLYPNPIVERQGRTDPIAYRDANRKFETDPGHNLIIQLMFLLYLFKLIFRVLWLMWPMQSGVGTLVTVTSRSVISSSVCGIPITIGKRAI
jgi:hypothetical protein